MYSLNRFESALSRDSQLSRVLSDFFGRAGQESSLSTWAPAVDISEDEHQLVVKADLPEIKPEDLDIRVENNILTIRGERKFEKKASEQDYLRVERAYGTFSRTFSLSNAVNTESIKADYKDGVLTLTLPKREEAKPKQIKVSAGSAALAASSAAAGR